MKTFKLSLVLRTRENTDVFITLDDNIYGIHSQRVNILYLFILVTLKIEYRLSQCSGGRKKPRKLHCCILGDFIKASLRPSFFCVFFVLKATF